MIKLKNNIEDLLDSLSKSKFRGSFHLNKKMKNYVKEKGFDKIKSKRNVERLIFLGIIVVKKIKLHKICNKRRNRCKYAINNNTRARYNNKGVNGI